VCRDPTALYFALKKADVRKFHTFPKEVVETLHCKRDSAREFQRGIVCEMRAKGKGFRRYLAIEWSMPLQIRH
jgi:hypothetical protein